MEDLHTSKLHAKVSSYETIDLLIIWNETEKRLMNKDIFVIREQIMRVLESRHKKQFDSWINAEYPNDNILTHFAEVEK